jgi:hypothetical protein
MTVPSAQMSECHGLIVREPKPGGTPALELAGRSNRNYLNNGNLISGFADGHVGEVDATNPPVPLCQPQGISPKTTG